MLVLIVLVSNVSHNNRRHDITMDIYGRELLESLPPNAVFFAEGDFDHGVLGYLHYLAGVRPDVELRSWDNLVFPNRLAGALVSAADKSAARQAFFDETDRPLITRFSSLAPHISLGGYYQYVPGKNQNQVRSNPLAGPGLDFLLLQYEQNLYEDPHQRFIMSSVLLDFARHYVALGLVGGVMNPDDMARIEAIRNSFFGQLATMEILLAQPSAELFLPVLTQAAARSRALKPDDLEPQQQALLQRQWDAIAALSLDH